MTRIGGRTPALRASETRPSVSFATDRRAASSRTTGLGFLRATLAPAAGFELGDGLLLGQDHALQLGEFVAGRRDAFEDLRLELLLLQYLPLDLRLGRALALRLDL